MFNNALYSLIQRQPNRLVGSAGHYAIYSSRLTTRCHTTSTVCSKPFASSLSRVIMLVYLCCAASNVVVAGVGCFERSGYFYRRGHCPRSPWLNSRRSSLQTLRVLTSKHSCHTAVKMCYNSRGCWREGTRYAD